MAETDVISLRSRTTRHVLFWLAWIFGFTFIKSLGEDLSVYLAWFIYYLITLPVFIIHTYIVVYWLVPRFLMGWKIILFFALFTLMIPFFSVIELIITQLLLSNWFPEVFIPESNYLDPGNIMISGLGNLYIVLVFGASKLIRSWYLVNEERRSMAETDMKDVVASNNRYIQPGFLMFAMELITEEAEQGGENLSPAIAMVSELQSGLMAFKDIREYRFDEELKLMRNLLDLVALLKKLPPPKLLVEAKESLLKNLPPLLAFSVLELTGRYPLVKAVDQVSILSPSDSCILEIGINSPADIDPSATAAWCKQINAGLDEMFPSAYITEIRKKENIFCIQVFER